MENNLHNLSQQSGAEVIEISTIPTDCYDPQWGYSST